MRDDPTPARDMRDPTHIWLRQSVSFSVNGQTRTLEMALPLRPGATPDEVDALLDEADAGMRRLSQRLDAHLAEVSGLAPATPGTPPPPAPEITQPAEPARRAEQQPASQPAAQPAPQPAAAQTQPAPAAPRPAPATRPLAPATPATPATPAAAASGATSAASGGPDLTRPQFLTAAGELGLDARTVMERLNVRSLNGLNLREALDLLRRQVLREGGPSAVASAPDPEPAPSASADAMPAPIGMARFDEEDEGPEFELSYPDPDDLPSDDDYATEEDIVAETDSTSALSDVPDLDDLLGAPPASAPSARAKPATSSTTSQEVTPPAAASQDDPSASTREIIATLRAAHPGGQAIQQQRSAYRNIVVNELGETKAASIVRAVWNVTPDKLGPEQLDALIRWGKQDTFADEVEAVLSLLRAEWLAQQAQQRGAAQPATSTPAPQRPAAQDTPKQTSTKAPAQAPAETPAKTPAARPAPRGRPSARANAASADGAHDGADSQGGV